MSRGKQHLAVQQSFSEQPNVIHQLSVLPTKFTFNRFMYGLFVASANAEQRTNVPYALPRFCMRHLHLCSDINRALLFAQFRTYQQYRSAAHLPHVHTFAVMSRVAPHGTTLFGAVRTSACSSVFLALPSDF